MRPFLNIKVLVFAVHPRKFKTVKGKVSRYSFRSTYQEDHQQVDRIS